ncbi:MlaE family ABC transporter permease [Nocardia bovistercoris]|uniref:ABC transporter permease n=1 Tax=Nocardia bovistercoris TaxID=2785916 RepID=A0A931IDF8_9NOCA|nr:ABC transporter permease [Nocardia bovistercoris]MBH0778486.1 ABC transporter permease [Nocardia bovistercoris]
MTHQESDVRADRAVEVAAGPPTGWATREIKDWSRGYLRRHPVTALETVGGQFVLGVRAVQYLILDIVTGRFAFAEFVKQSAFMANAAVLPTIFVSLPIGVTLSIQFGLLAGQVGATSLAGAASGLAVIRQGAPMVAALLMASAVGSAVCADLGSRKIREELDAMEVMGVSVVRRLVVPRLAAAILVGVSLTGVVCFVGFLAGYMFNVFVQNGAPGSFVATFASFATVSDLILTLFKAVMYGAIVAVVACEKGLSTKGGPAGVANSVNSTVVSSILLLMTVNVVVTQLAMILLPRQGL